MTFALPSLLDRTDNWGAFIFFAAWCAGGLLYVYLLVPEIAGLTVEEIDRIFNGTWMAFGRRSKPGGNHSIMEDQEDMSQKS